MIRDFSIHAKPASGRAKLVFTALMLTAAAVVVVSMFLESYRGVIGMLGMFIVVAATWVYTRHVAADYYYDLITYAGDEPTLIVRQIIGKRQSTLSRVYLADIVSAEMEDAAARRAHKTEKGVRKYVYTPTMSPERTCRLTVRSRSEHSEIVLELTDEYCNLINEYSREARELRSLSEE